MRDEASAWLARTGSDQWTTAWPDPDTMVANIQRSIQTGCTWSVEDDAGNIAATIAMDTSIFPGLWTEREEAEPAVYVHRLIVRRAHSGRGLGAQLLNWAGNKAVLSNAQWVRVDVWTTNLRLRQYYVDQGFTHVRTVVRADYPSGALLQRRAEMRPTPLLYREAD